ncbi:MAG: Levanase [Candidatus Ordinivivax streblomastigis]|uniref:Levanase n=1 Tax=Candidatus Ordinivivax streblomastigis TaxID=2540710 RepID=A0A5M8P3N9_9BACT|nr:MAG: Levanase [Candidatus Ordinivivax streblomastigis]
MEQSFFRKHWNLLIILLGLVSTPAIISAQSQFLPTNYDEPFRQQFHFSQQSGWMNDINGIWYLDGVYHLTYQSDPFSLNGGHDGIPRYWGHATSPDLIHWTQQPTILDPIGTDPNGNVPGECWSGSTVIDFNNTSGFGTAENPPLVSIYSATNNIGTCLAYSLDKGTTWVAYEHNPVNVATTNAYETRDPHVFWHEPTQKWVCVIYENGFAFYNSPDLKTWTKTSTFGSGWGYECPDMFELAVDDGTTKKFVLLRGDGKYYVGDFNGVTFTPEPGGDHNMTYNEGFGGSFYASQTFFQKNFPGGKVVQMAWMLGLGPGSTAPWTHNSTFPVEIKLKTFPKGIRATRTPVSEIETLYQSTCTWTNEALQAGQNLLTGKYSKTFDLEVVLDVSNTTATDVTFQFANKQISYNIAAQTLFGHPLQPVNNQVKLRFLVDWGSVEIFGNDGAYSWVENFKFTPSDAFLSMRANGNITLVSARLSNIERTWAGVANNTYVDDNTADNQYTGSWIHATNEGGYYNYDCHVGTTANSSVEYRFTGTQISWYGLKNNDLGIASVYIDNNLVEDIDCYSTIRIVQQLFTKTGLTDDTHTIKVVLKGTKNPASNGIALVHDYFGFVSEYVDSPETRPIITDDASAATIYGGGWFSVNNDNAYFNNTCHVTKSAEADFQYSFTGSHISWYGLKNNDLGFATAYIDDIKVAEIDCYSTERRVYLLLDKGLPAGNHTLKIVAKGVKKPASNGFALVHDYFSIVDGASEADTIEGIEEVVPEPTTGNLQHFIMYGQSLSTGHEASPVSTTNIAGNYMLGSQIWINYGNRNHTQLFPLSANIAAGLSDLSESPLHGAVNHIRLKHNTNAPLSDRFIATSSGVSGQSIESLSKESQQDALYDNYKNTLYYGKKVAEQEHNAIHCPVLFWLQGEWNYMTEGNGMTQGTQPTADKNEYKTLLLQLKNNMQADAQATYFQTDKPIFITYQTGAQYSRGRELAIGMAQLEASNEHNDLVCAGPVYQMTDVGGHLDGNGYRWYGELLGKVYYKTKVLGENFLPLQPKSLSRVADDPKKIRVTFHVPVPPLVLDVHTLTQKTNYGFNVYSGRTQTIDNVQIVNDSVVEITTRNALSVSESVSVFYGGEATQGHGNLRDSDPYQAFFNYERPPSSPPSGEPKDENGNVIYGKPYPLYNFCVAFYYEIPAGSDRYVVSGFTDDVTSIAGIKKAEIAVDQLGKSIFVTLSGAGNVTVELYSILGEKVQQFNRGYQSLGEKKEYSLSSVLSGIYIVAVKTPFDSINRKISL